MFDIKPIIDWCNENSGFLTLIIFIFTITIGWLSGFFAQIKKQPKFKIELVDIPTFACKVHTVKKYNEYDCYRTAIVLYLSISNIGTAPADIVDIEVGYKSNSLDPLLQWFWLKQTNSLSDFAVTVGDTQKVYPFFTQHNYLVNNCTKTFINIGENKFGIKYFESDVYYGDCEPKVENNKIKIILKLKDAYGKQHYKNFTIPVIPLEEAKKFNEKFGLSKEMANEA